MKLLTEAIAVSGSHYQRGFTAGQRLADSIAANVNFFWQQVEENNLVRDELLALTYEDEEKLPLQYREEIRGMAEASGLNYRELLAYNLYRAGLLCDC